MDDSLREGLADLVKSNGKLKEFMFSTNRLAWVTFLCVRAAQDALFPYPDSSFRARPVLISYSTLSSYSHEVVPKKKLNNMKERSSIALIVFILCSWMSRIDSAKAEDLEPRRWTPLPLGTNVVGVGYAHTTGDVLFDPVLNVQDATVKVDTVYLSHVNSFSLAGKLARFDVLVPWQQARWDGLLNGQPASVQRTGFADPRFRLSVNLLGVPDAGVAELGKYMASRPDNTIVGAAVAVTVPLGEYYNDKLLNLGQNRYTIQPQIGAVHSRGPWSYELTGSVFFFTDNNDFYNGGKREQDPLYYLQAHVVRMFGPGLWASLSAGYGTGGRSTVNGVHKDDENANLLSALSVGFPVSRSQGIKIAYLRARTHTDTGSNTDSIAIGWSMRY